MKKLAVFLFLFLAMASRAEAVSCYTQMEGAAFGTVTATNNEAGACRVVTLEAQLAAMTIHSDHPRLYITSSDIAALQAKSGQAAYTAVINGANSTTARGMLNSAMAYLLTGTASYATNVYTYINNTTYSVDSSISCLPSGSSERLAIGEAALAFDWAYDGLSSGQRSTIQSKIETAYNFAAKKAEIDAGTVPISSCTANWRTSTRGETWHREEWMFFSNYIWPVVAFAGHNADAAAIFKSIWGVNWYWGDQARAITYFADGIPFEGYYYGSEGLDWFRILKSATGINLIDDTVNNYYQDSANYILHKLDFGTRREVLHRGVGGDTVGSSWYDSTAAGGVTWKSREYSARNLSVIAANDPYANWVWNNEIMQGAGSSYSATGPRHTSWQMANPYFGDVIDVHDVSDLIFMDETWTTTNIKTATNSQKAYDFIAPNGGEIISRSSWGDNATIFNFNADVQFTPNSHWDYSTNDISIYRRGNLSKSSGLYDATDGQFNYMQYQKTTNAHNSLLIINSSNPNGPKKLGGAAVWDPGGTEDVGSYRFSGSGSAFIRNNPFGSTKAEWARMNKYETHDDYSYACGDATTAYSSRASNYDRCVVFWRLANDEAYVDDFSRVTATSASYTKKMLYHTVMEPSVGGSVTSTEIPGHIINYNGTTWNSLNYQNNSKLFGKVLLPSGATIRKVGGETVVTSGTATATISSTTVTGSGTTWLTDLANLENGAHWFHMNADSDTHSPERWFRIATIDSDTQLTLSDAYTPSTKSGAYTINRGYQWWMGSTPARNRMPSGAYRGFSAFNNTYYNEDGNWHLEVIPGTSQTTDYFLTTLYAADSASSAPANNTLITSTGGGDMYGALVGNTVAMFSKTDTTVSGTTFAVTNNATTKILLTDLQTGYNYNVTKNGSALVSNQPASNMGTIYFSTNPGAGGSTFVVSQVGAALSITTTACQSGQQGSAYGGCTISASGGTTPYTFTITAGSLPTGLSLNSSTGAITGTASGSGTSNFTVTVTDAVPNTASQALSILINPTAALTVTTTSLNAGIYSEPYSAQMTATGGTAPYTWDISAGTLPRTLSLSSSGLLSGTLTQIGGFDFTVRATDNVSATDTQALTLVSNGSVLSISTTNLPSVEVGVAYDQQLASTGGANGIKTWTLGAGSSLPPGLSLSSSGAITGTPTTKNTYIFNIVVTDSLSITDTKMLSIEVTQIPTSIQYYGRFSLTGGAAISQ